MLIRVLNFKNDNYNRKKVNIGVVSLCGYYMEMG